MDDAQIIIHSRYDENTNTRLTNTYEWSGEPRTTLISSQILDSVEIEKGEFGSDVCFLDSRKRIRVGPYRLRLIGEAYPFTFRYIREDYPLWALFVFLYRLRVFLSMIGGRMVVTLAVWNLADYRREVVPSYRDIHFVKRLRKILHKI